MHRFQGVFESAEDVLRSFDVAGEWDEHGYDGLTCDGCGRTVGTARHLCVRYPVWMTLCESCGEAYETARAGELADDEVIYAEYTYEDYSGRAWVLYQRGGTLYEAFGSHCSCHGLEGQWEPEETTLEAIMMRPLEGWLVPADQLRARILDQVMTSVTVERLADFLQSPSRVVREAAMLRIGSLRHHAA